jgi:hypothetical protein
MLRSMVVNNPQMQQVLQANPQLTHVLNDPSVMRQTLEMMRSPAAMREAMRNQDLAMSNLETHPEGFNALRRMYSEVQVCCAFHVHIFAVIVHSYVLATVNSVHQHISFMQLCCHSWKRKEWWFSSSVM